MAINLKNYTSTVPASTSMANIERCLVEAGASDISKKYDANRVCVSITFRVMVNTVPLFFQLPARVVSCFKVLYAEVKRPQPDTKTKIYQQAERTAWKIIAEWVQIQLSMIQLDQAELLQVLLPYVWDPKTDQTYFEKLKSSQFKELGYGGN